MINELKEIVLEAGNIVKEGYFSDKNIKFKGEVDLVTEYDVRCEEFLKEKIEKAFPGFKIVAEESSQNIWGADGDVIYIDPIDGTTNFVHGIPFVAISIGVFNGTQGKCGVVYNPILNEMFYAEAGKGAYCNDMQIAVSKTNKLLNALIATGFPYNRETLPHLIKIFEKAVDSTRGVRRLGAASLDLCYTAKGIFDLYYETTLKPWDMAAGMIIVREAGGLVTYFDGKEHDINSHEILASNKVIHKEFLDILAQYK